MGKSRIRYLIVAQPAVEKIFMLRFKGAVRAFDDGLRGVIIGHDDGGVAATRATASNFD